MVLFQFAEQKQLSRRKHVVVDEDSEDEFADQFARELARTPELDLNACMYDGCRCIDDVVFAIKHGG